MARAVARFPHSRRSSTVSIFPGVGKESKRGSCNMKARHYSEVRSIEIEMEGAEGVSKRVLAGPEEDVPNFVMRLFELAPGGRTPNHTHDWEHEVFVVEGQGHAESAEGDRPLGPGSAVYVAPGERHGFVNTGDSPMRFICVVPRMD